LRWWGGEGRGYRMREVAWRVPEPPYLSTTAQALARHVGNGVRDVSPRRRRRRCSSRRRHRHPPPPPPPPPPPRPPPPCGTPWAPCAAQWSPCTWVPTRGRAPSPSCPCRPSWPLQPPASAPGWAGRCAAPPLHAGEQCRRTSRQSGPNGNGRETMAGLEQLSADHEHQVHLFCMRGVRAILGHRSALPSPHVCPGLTTMERRAGGDVPAVRQHEARAAPQGGGHRHQRDPTAACDRGARSRAAAPSESRSGSPVGRQAEMDEGGRCTPLATGGSAMLGWARRERSRR
jgi:hypothetical protein